ncbi:MAG: hypothetical protein KKH41_00745 [Candidatus Thermoplasmatota archaeon]|nr:hypothetical protein [Euryarchaeota archaeon]MBU4032238.1 hypothetical protein [Candidatus Thermoplasmatota archaeon]MBU4071926.1 hypothetical protein [Candidatus Thermoplasmatota archaeon]MBU4144429.1 hypothetical protein [Candidatus Thermoplasmatota archaeon]MBU4591089.1 hypothetical protein [Candidatus Thermoplasmatota archaeon]
MESGQAKPSGNKAAPFPRPDTLFAQTAWIQIAPYPDERKKISALEVASVILGIIAISIHWVVFFQWGFLLFVVPLILSILAVVFGYISVHKMLRKDYVRENGEGSAGLAGLSMGILTLMFTIAWLVLAQTYLWGWNL